jgi:DNA-binding SARP family transcriptional activator
MTGFVSNKGRALLTYLALESDRPHRRDALAEMLWPNRPNPFGRNNLRQTLHHLRKLIGDPLSSTPFLLIPPHEVEIHCLSDYWLDTSEFSQLLASVIDHHQTDLILCEDCLKDLQNAAALYHGDLLAGFSVPDCPHFDWWLLAKIEEYHRQAMSLLDRLVIHFKQKGDYSSASQYAQRAIDLEPWRERSHRMKMRALALGGDPIAAIRQYETCRKILKAEMEIEPSAKTKNLLGQIQLGYVLSLSNLAGEFQLMEPLAV